jgi:hypothetical protein
MIQKKNPTPKSRASKEGTPKFRSPYEGRFKSPEEAKKVLFAVASFLRAKSNRVNPSDDEGDFLGFAIEYTEVNPNQSLKRIRMETKFASGKVIIHLPRTPEESDESFSLREQRILADFATTIYEAQMRSAWEFYWALNDEGQKNLVEIYGNQKEKN